MIFSVLPPYLHVKRRSGGREDCARDHGQGSCEYVNGVAIAGKCVQDEAVIAEVEHEVWTKRSTKIAPSLCRSLLYRHAAGCIFDDDVDLFGCVFTDANFANIHYMPLVTIVPLRFGACA